MLFVGLFKAVFFGYRVLTGQAELLLEFRAAGLPALRCGEPGQVRKEAATADFFKCRGSGSPLH